MDVNGNLHAPAAFIRYPLDKRLDGPQNRSAEHEDHVTKQFYRNVRLTLVPAAIYEWFSYIFYTSSQEFGGYVAIARAKKDYRGSPDISPLISDAVQRTVAKKNAHIAIYPPVSRHVISCES
jgi:hypothetical protein